MTVLVSYIRDKNQDWNTLLMSAESVDNLGSISLGCCVHLSVVFGTCCSDATVIAVVRRL